MIKTGRVEGKETGTLEMSGTLNDLMNDYNVIAKGMRKKYLLRNSEKKMEIRFSIYFQAISQEMDCVKKFTV